MTLTDEDLNLVESERLLDALGRRCESYVFIQSVRDTEKTTMEYVSWQGSYPTAIGLCYYGASRLESRQLQQVECECGEMREKHDRYCPHCGRRTDAT